MLKTYVEKLLTLEPQDLEIIAFLHEPRAGLLSADQRHSLWLQAQACGKHEAENLRKQVGDCSIEQIVQLCGGRILEIEEIPDPRYALFAYYEKPNDITVNIANALRSVQLIKEYRLEPLLDNVCIRDLLLSHELYHLLVSRKKDSFVQQRHVRLLGLGHWALKGKLECLEEIAAMAFSSELLHLSCSPYVYHVIMLYACHPEQAEKMMADYAIL